jgi:hypothetical protein
MMKKAFLYTAALFALSLTACETVVDIDLPEHKPALVVNSLFSPEDTFVVNVSHSKGSLDKGNIDDITNATVEVYKNGSYLLSLDNLGDGRYTSAIVHPQPGEEYMLKVSAPNYDAVSATSSVPVTVPITSFAFEDSAYSNNYGGYIGRIDITFNDPPEHGNYYLIQLLQADSAGNLFSLYIYPANSESSAETGTYFGILVNDELINGSTYTVSGLFDNYLLPAGPGPVPAAPPLVARLRSVTKEFYLYHKTVDLQQSNQGNPFSEPVHVYNNIENGFGIFAGSSADTVKVR